VHQLIASFQHIGKSVGPSIIFLHKIIHSYVRAFVRTYIQKTWEGGEGGAMICIIGPRGYMVHTYHTYLYLRTYIDLYVHTFIGT